MFFFTVYIHNSIATLYIVHPLLYHRHRMVAVYLLLVKETMTTGAGIVGLILDKLLVLGVSEHLVKHKVYDVL